MSRELLSRARLKVFDFDQTIADTNQKSPNGLNVVTAYARALDEIFGTHAVLEAIGGLKNRAPAELIQEVLRRAPSLVANAWDYYALAQHRLSGLVSLHKGVDLDRAYVLGDTHGFCTELLVRVKLWYLNQEQGRGPHGVWPPPCNGADAYLKTLQEKEWGIISSGHELFIADTFSLWGVSYPRFVVTDDEVRGLSLPVAVTTKPSGFLFDFLLAQAARIGVYLDRKDIVYVGDDPDKDGGLAENAGVPFLCYNPRGKPLPEGMAELRDWNELVA